MDSAPPRRSRRRPVTRTIAAVGLLSVLPGMGIAGASAAHHRGSCPPAESLIPGTTFVHHTLAKGVVMSAGTATDATGTVNIHVLRVDLTRPRVEMVPLMQSLANWP